MSFTKLSTNCTKLSMRLDYFVKIQCQSSVTILCVGSIKHESKMLQKEQH